MVQINPNSWHCKVYMWWYNHKYPKVAGAEYKEPKTESNLCPYVRVVLLWAPIRALSGDWITFFNDTIPSFFITWTLILIALPLIFRHKAKPILGMYLFIVAYTALVYSLGTLIEYCKKKREQKEKNASEKNTNTFINLLGKYLRASHDRVCPEVSWRKKN